MLRRPSTPCQGFSLARSALARSAPARSALARSALARSALARPRPFARTFARTYAQTFARTFVELAKDCDSQTLRDAVNLVRKTLREVSNTSQSRSGRVWDGFGMGSGRVRDGFGTGSGQVWDGAEPDFSPNQFFRRTRFGAEPGSAPTRETNYRGTKFRGEVPKSFSESVSPNQVSRRTKFFCRSRFFVDETKKEEYLVGKVLRRPFR